MTKNKSTIEYLLADELLKQSNYPSLARLLPKVNEMHFAAGEKIYPANAAANYFFLLIDGEVKLVSQEGRETGLIHGRFGEEAASDAEHYLTNAIAVTAVTVLAIPRLAIAALVEANPALKTDFLFSLASHMSGETLARNLPEHDQKNETLSANPVKIAGWSLASILPILVLLYGGKLGLERSAVIFMAIFSVTVVMWVFSLVEDYIPALFALVATLATGLVPAQVVLSGFASDGFMMALSTLALGAVVVSSGLSYRMMLSLLMRLPNNQF
ncbi:MAG: cyclic nucleotide-binding domain-containing protein, partial [Burkholderiaceae bacterium]